MMKRFSLLVAGMVGGMTAVVMVALTYLGNQMFGLPFVPFDIFDWMARRLPGGLIAIVIDTMAKATRALKLGPTATTAKLVEQGIALIQFVLAGIFIGIILELIGRRRPGRFVQLGALLGAICCGGIILTEIAIPSPSAGRLLTLLWLIVIFPGWGAVLGRLIREIGAQPHPTTRLDADQPAQEVLSRRLFLYLVGAGSFITLLSAAGLKLFHLAESPAGIQGTTPIEGQGKVNSPAGTNASPPQSTLAARFEPVAGTRPELTPNDKFYRIDIDSIPPQINGQTWRLEVGGLVDKPLSLSLDDIRSRKSFTQAITLACISNLVGGDLISTSLWTGVPLKDILDEAGLKPGALEIALTAADFFYESVPLSEALDERTLLVYEMNGEPLPVEHGYPLRIYIPNHYGMKQPKWITRLEVIDIERDPHKGPGYWVDRGWSPTATVRMTSVVDSVAVNQRDPQNGVIPVGGIAFAGARGISRVEVQIDAGPWEEVELRIPPLSNLTWVQWRYAWKASPGQHIVRVRAYDGQGVLQETEEHPPLPNGARGIHSFITNIQNK